MKKKLNYEKIIKEKRLFDLLKDKTIRDVSKIIKVSYTSIRRICEQYNFKIPQRQENTRFKRNLKPWNKNLKGIHLSLRSEFKKGQIPWNKDKEYPQIKGEKNFNWKGGITPFTNFRIQNRKWFIRRKECYRRDDFKCRLCETNKNLVAHHIVPFTKEYQNNELSNLITLCNSCHGTIHWFIRQEINLFGSQEVKNNV